MSDINWTAVAVQFAGSLRTLNSPGVHGILTNAEHPDVRAIYAPDTDRGKLLDELTAKGIEVLGKAHHIDIGRGSIFVAVVRSTDAAMLESILNKTAAG